MSTAAKAAYFWRSAAQGLRHAPFVHGIAVLTIAIALFTTGLTRGGLRLLEYTVSQLGGEIEVTIYLADSVSDVQAQEWATAWARRSGGQAQVISPQVALERLAKDFGEMGDVLAELPSNPLPVSISLSVPQELRNRESLKRLADELRKEPGVVGVDYGEEAVERLGAIAAAIRYGGMVAFLIVAVATIVIVSATLQLAIYARREEIEIQKLVGATDRFVKIPFLMEGLLQGVLGAVVALLGLWACSAYFAGPLSEVFSFLLSKGTPPLVSVLLCVELVAAGCCLGLGGSFIAVGRFLRV